MPGPSWRRPIRPTWRIGRRSGPAGRPRRSLQPRWLLCRPRGWSRRRPPTERPPEEEIPVAVAPEETWSPAPATSDVPPEATPTPAVLEPIEGRPEGEGPSEAEAVEALLEPAEMPAEGLLPPSEPVPLGVDVDETDEDEEELRRRKKAGKPKERRRVRYEIDFEDETWLRRMRGGRVQDWLDE